MPFNLESHLLIILEHLLSHERTHFFETFDVQSEHELQDLIPDPSVQHLWKSAHILCRAFDAGFITIKGTHE